MSNIFKTKSINDLLADAPGEPKLKRTLGAGNLTTLGIGAIIGAGIFVLTGQAAAEHAGPAIVLSFIVSGFACALAGLCYAEFASMIPVAGSAYTYAYATLGEIIAWIIGWDLIIEYLFAASTVAVGWSGYMVSILKDFGIIIPQTLSKAPYDYDDTLEKFVSTGAIINLPAVIIVALISILLVVGIKESAKFNNIIVVIKISVILLFIAVGIAYINVDNWTPFIPENTGKPENFGFSGIIAGASVIFFSYIGFDAVSTAAQEAKNPQKDMPVGILASLAVSTILYILVSLVMTGMVSYKTLNVPDPIAVAVNAIGGLGWLKKIIKLGAIAGLSSVILVMLMGQSRIFFAMSKDGLLPKKFSALHPKFKTPYFSTLVTGLFAMVIAALFPIGILGKLVSIGTLFAFFLVCIGVLVLRYKRPDIHRPFRTPAVHVVSILGAAVVLYLMLALGKDNWIRLFAWMAIGICVYYFYGRKNSVVGKS